MNKKKIVVEKGTLRDIEFPKILYKYRYWNNDYHKRFITKREVFMASAKTFKDELDCHNPTRYDLLTSDQIFELYLSDSQKLNQHFTQEQHIQFAKEWTKKSPLKDEKKIPQLMVESVQKFYEHEGILSLTENWNNDEMWEKYADKHKGFCIGYNSNVLFEYLSGGGVVDYVDEIPKIYPEPIMSYFEAMQNRVYKKDKKWEFEQEYRTKKFYNRPATIEDRRILLPKEAFNHIIIGNAISDFNKEELIKNVQKYIGKIEIISRNT